MERKSTTGIPAMRLAIAAMCLTTATASSAQGMSIPDCNTWKASSQAEQTAFIVGVANTFALQLAYVTKTRRPDLSPGERASKALANVSIADVDSRVTAWCNANPGKANMPVIGVIWIDLVKPKLGL